MCLQPVNYKLKQVTPLSNIIVGCHSHVASEPALIFIRSSHGLPITASRNVALSYIVTAVYALSVTLGQMRNVIL